MATTSDPLGLFGSVLPGIAGAYGYDTLLDNLDTQREATAQGITDLQSGIDSRTEFQPWSVTSNLGSVTGGPNGTTDMQLSTAQERLQRDLFSQGRGQMQAASQDPTGREQEVYDRMMAAFQPGQDRRAAEMRERLERTGRSGIRSERYGGSPEELAMAKAQQEGQNAAMLNAMGFAQDELNSQFQRGTGMLNQAYLPQQNLQKQAGIGTNLKQLDQQRQLENAGMFAQLGLGGMTADTNFSNIEGNAFGNMITAMMPLLQGAGTSIDQAGGLGGLWDIISEYIPDFGGSSGSFPGTT